MSNSIKKNEFLIIGYGSMGRRHLKNLIELFGDEIEIDVLRQKDRRRDEASKAFFLLSENELRLHYDAIFICNPTFMHQPATQRDSHHLHAA